MTNDIDEFVSRDSNNYSDDNGNSNSSTKYPKFICFSINDRLSYSEQLTTMLEMIYIDFDNIKDEIDESISRNPGNHSNGDRNSSTEYPKFISFLSIIS